MHDKLKRLSRDWGYSKELSRPSGKGGLGNRDIESIGGLPPPPPPPPGGGGLKASTPPYNSQDRPKTPQDERR